jgi:hypothetical protein
MAIATSLEQAPTLEVSPTQELVIPASVLEKLGIQPGQRFVVLAYQHFIQLVPLISREEARGSMPGLDTTVDREDDENRV